MKWQKGRSELYLENIKSPDDVKTLPADKIPDLCSEIRDRILSSVSENGGHLSSNLGTVELTVAIHRVFSTPDDKVVFDVGHQSYTHKLLTGREKEFEHLRTENGVCGFTKRSESEHDAFGSGHSGNALSASVGLAESDRMAGRKNYTVAVIGDGGFTNGMTYEALNNCAGKNLRLIVILNDNEMAISHNVGTVDNIFSRMRNRKGYFRFKNRVQRRVEAIPIIGKGISALLRAIKNAIKHILIRENFFETMGFEYYGPVDGHDTEKLIDILTQAKTSGRVCIVHVNTKKGKGYAFAEAKPDTYHSVSRFDTKTGIVPNGKEFTFSYNAGKILEKEAENDKKICAVTAAMTGGTGLSDFAKKYPDRFFDVGIAEEHAVTFCAGLSAGGMKPVFAVYSTFLQRAFDQICEDVRMQNLDITLFTDRAGLVGDDGITHHGLFDVSLISSIPDTYIWSPDSIDELEYTVKQALSVHGISEVRYPKGREAVYDRSVFLKSGDNMLYADFGKPKKVIVTYGTLAAEAFYAGKEYGDVRVVKLLKIRPIDKAELEAVTMGLPVLFAEEGVRGGGIGEYTASILKNKVCVSAFDTLPEHGSRTYLLKKAGLDKDGIMNSLKAL